jgi:hypothetical protein
MSVIIAGMCKECDEEYYDSFGHPSWFGKQTKDLSKTEKIEKKIVLKFQESNMCSLCYFKMKKEKEQDRMENGLNKYKVIFHIEGNFEIEVEATSKEHAKALADEDFNMSDVDDLYVSDFHAREI